MKITENIADKKKINEVLREKNKNLIVRILMKGKKNYSDILGQFPGKDSGKLNHHLKQLQELGLAEKIGDKYMITLEGEKYGVYINQFQLEEMYPIPVVCVAILDKDKILLGRRAKEPYLGQWVLPGGKVDVGETIEEACHRQIEDEIGANIKNLRVYGIYPTIVWSELVLRNHVYLIAVRAELKAEPKGNRNGDLDKFEFFSKKEMKKLIIPKSNLIMIKDAFKEGFNFKEQVIDLSNFCLSSLIQLPNKP